MDIAKHNFCLHLLNYHLPLKITTSYSVKTQDIISNPQYPGNHLASELETSSLTPTPVTDLRQST